ncbi:hypothetical protein Trco_004031 [Trichoderma cornu-damae]|uniref:Uncharacterized protein n=1 Tax=Trichoderma cornu-damae TaxID=654480 RepID=A0A9P8TWQ8_9HYPO|nr:hypothetical protein Trco_004031 [Trichoderma cornu-damae]
MRSLALFLFSLAGSGTAAPHGQTVGQQLIQGVSTDAVPGESKDSAAPLPGFNHLARNRTQAVIESPDRAAFEGACVQVTLGGHGKVGMTTLEGRPVDGRFICGSRVGIKSPAFATGRSVA